MAKRVPTTKGIENKGLIAIVQFADNLGWAWRPTPNDDYGLDGELEPVEEGEPTGKIIKVQVKSGRSYLKGETDSSFYYLASKDDLQYWDSVNVPVLLVVHDPASGRTYGAEVHSALQDDPSVRRTRRIPFDKGENLLAQASESRLLAVAKDEQRSGRIFRRPGGGLSENLYSNLLPILSLPRFIYGAPTDCRTQADIRTRLGERRKTPAIPADGMLWTFADLNAQDCSLRVLCNAAKITRQSRHDWQADPNRSRLLVQLFNTCLRKKLAANGLIYDLDKNRYYFPPDDGGERRFTWRSLRNQINKPVVYPHVGSTGAVDYWVHWAARFRFMFFGRPAYLMVEPAMVFTRDGTQLVGGEEMGRLATARASHRYNRNVLGFLFFWKEFLREGNRDIVVFGAPPPQRLAAHGSFVGALAEFGIHGDTITVTEVGKDLDEIDLTLSDDEADDFEGESLGHLEVEELDDEGDTEHQGDA